MAEPQDVQTTVMRAARSPRSAAAAGILFSLLTATSMILLKTGAIVDLAEIDRDWLEASSPSVSAALFLIPFAGIAFLWFTGVMRDLLGELEDKFFATVFLGSGIILVVMMFVWAAAFGAMFGTYQNAAGTLRDFDVFIYATAFTNQIIGDYFLRMASVYMSRFIFPAWVLLVSVYILFMNYRRSTVLGGDESVTGRRT
jgi:hypothetical protein